MNRASRLLSRGYRCLLRLYPASFRTGFGAEMEDVFAEAVAGATAQAWTSLAGLLLRELRDWPGALLRAHWLALRKEMMMDEHTESMVVSSHDLPVLEERHAPAPWREALLAGLPHGIAALAIQGVGVALAYDLLPYSSQELKSSLAVPIIVAIVLGIVAAMVIAWRRGWPRWSASWYPYVFMLLVLPLGGLLQEWEGPARSWSLKLLLPSSYFNLLVPLLAAALLCVLGLRDRLKLLLAVLPLVLLLWAPMMEFGPHPIRTVVALVAWLCAALVAVLIARSGSVRSGVWMVLTFSLVMGLAYSYMRTYHPQFPPGAPAHYLLPPTLLDWLVRFVPIMLATCVVVLEPLLVRRPWVLGQRSKPVGVLGFRVSLTGLMLHLAAALTASWWFTSGSGVIRLVWGYEVAEGTWLGVLVYGAILLYSAGAIVLGAAMIRAGLSLGEVASLSLAFVLIALPAIAALAMTYGFWDLRTIPAIWTCVFGLLWPALGMWLVTHRSTGRQVRSA